MYGLASFSLEVSKKYVAVAKLSLSLSLSLSLLCRSLLLNMICALDTAF
jgi:hypothetical protein